MELASALLEVLNWQTAIVVVYMVGFVVGLGSFVVVVLGETGQKDLVEVGYCHSD